MRQKLLKAAKRQALKRNKLKESGMLKNDSVRSKVKEYLEKQSPLTPVMLDDLYPLFTTAQSNIVIAALHGLSVGTPVSERNCPSKFYAIRLKLGDKEVFLTLPGVPSGDLRKDVLSKNRTESTIARLQAKYGKDTVDYWVQSAQHRSVVLSASGMRGAKKRDKKTCLLCGVGGRDAKQPVTACHIVSRKTLFWEALDEVEKVKGNIFTDEAVTSLKLKLKNNDLHSNLKFIVTLCLEHDNLLQAAVSESVVRNNISRRKANTPLFDNQPL
jgi:ribosomal protein S20